MSADAIRRCGVCIREGFTWVVFLNGDRICIDDSSGIVDRIDHVRVPGDLCDEMDEIVDDFEEFFNKVLVRMTAWAATALFSVFVPHIQHQLNRFRRYLFGENGGEIRVSAGDQPNRMRRNRRGEAERLMDDIRHIPQFQNMDGPRLRNRIH